MFYEPQTTQFDLNFAIGKIPVRINPFFWLLVILLGRNLSPPMLLLWIIAATLSLLIHELGHALALKYFHISSLDSQISLFSAYFRLIFGLTLNNFFFLLLPASSKSIILSCLLALTNFTRILSPSLYIFLYLSPTTISKSSL